jgi:hypothetical protein
MYRWVKKFDHKMRSESRHVCLLVDNFSAHVAISYEPTNIQLKFFEPNLTSFVQPCDAGIIRCFKALYCRNFCTRAIDLNEAGEHNIYKNNLLEGMMMARAAWSSVLSTTIKNCWDHTQIQLSVFFF